MPCAAWSTHLTFFEDLIGDVGEVEGIKSGLDIKGIGTFKFKIKDNNGMLHEIKIPNSLYVPELRRCLLSPQHWVQEAKDNYPRPKGTMMGQDDEFYYVYWGQAKYRKSIPYNPLTNVLILYTTASLHAYQAFPTTFEAPEATFFQRERVLQFPGHGRTVNKPEGVPEEFVVEENVNYRKDVSASEGANASSTQQNTESRSYSTIATKDTSTTMPSNKHATKQGNNSPSVGSMPTFKMASPSKPPGTSQKAHGSNCSTRAPAGQRRSTLLCGLMPCGMQPTFTTTYQC
jgi:hypothetical protein